MTGPSDRVQIFARRLAAVFLAMSCAAPAWASSDDAWTAFRADVAAQCLEAAKPLFASAEVVVDPFGSESYGLALLRGKPAGPAEAAGSEEVEISAICVYDKATKTVELGGELPETKGE